MFGSTGNNTVANCLFLIVIVVCFLPVNLPAQKSMDKEYVIGSGDVLEIRVWDHEDLHRTVELSQNGAFSFPLIGKVSANGLTVFGLEKLLSRRLADRYLISPQVTINVSEYRNMKVFILGEVKKPGSYVIKRKSHLLEVISEADGFTDEAGPTITIVRPFSGKTSVASHSKETASDVETITINLDQLTVGRFDKSLFVVAGDSIHVSRAPYIFVTGEVNQPGRFKWYKGLTIRQAISIAGGPTQRAATKRTKILRLEKNIEKVLRLNLTQTVLPGDVITVPESYF